MIDDDIGSDGIQYVDGFGPSHFPGTCRERVRLGREGSHGTNIDDVAGKFASEHLFDVRADLKIVASPRRAKLFNARDLVAESNATRALQYAMNKLDYADAV